MELKTRKIYESEHGGCSICPFERYGWCDLYDWELPDEDDLKIPDFCKLVRVLVIEKEKG